MQRLGDDGAAEETDAYGLDAWAKPSKARLSRADFTNGRSLKPSNSTYWARARSAPARFASGEMRSISPDN